MCTCSISYRTVTVMSTVNQLILGIEHGILSEIGTKQGYTGWNPLTFLCDTVLVFQLVVVPTFLHVFPENENWIDVYKIEQVLNLPWSSQLLDLEHYLHSRYFSKKTAQNMLQCVKICF